MQTETMERISVRGEIKALEVGGRLELPKDQYVLSSVRNTATSIKGDTGRKFKVSGKGKLIVVIRES